MTLASQWSPAFAATTTFQRGVQPTASYTAMYDNTVYPSNTSTGKANAGTVYVNIQTGSRVVSYFDLSSLPAGATITAATLSYNLSSGANIQGTVGVYRVRTNWIGGAAWTTAGEV